MKVTAQLKQRADYTHKYNMHSGRHGWLRLTPAYSVMVAEKTLTHCDAGEQVLDPFCGSGTTALCAARHGLSSVTTDINPFLVWLTGVKTKSYLPSEIAITRDACEDVLHGVGRLWEPVISPPIHKVERWWSKADLSFLCDLKGAIDKINTSKTTQDLLLVAFCRTLIKLSNAAFNHQSMSFKKRETELDLATDHKGIFREDVARVIDDCAEEIRGNTSVIQQDSRALQRKDLGTFDRVITSPPYANRMSYIRELRPYMYWLGYLENASEAGALDWQAIGGTWGVATSRLNSWKASENYQNDHLSSVVAAISESDNKHSETLSRYVHKYCEDIFDHLASLSGVLNSGARVHYIIGNSTFYGVLVQMEELYVDMIRKIGFSETVVKPIRKRNSRKELIEFEVSATWNL